MKHGSFVPFMLMGIMGALLIGCATSSQETGFKDISTLQAELAAKEGEDGGKGNIPIDRPEIRAWDQLRLFNNSEMSAKGWSVASSGRGHTYVQSYPFNKLKVEGQYYLGTVHLYEEGRDTPSVVFIDTNAVNMGYGSSTAISTDNTLVVIGAPGVYSTDAAYLYAYLRSPTGWDAVSEGNYPTLFGMPGSEGSRLGAHVAVSGGSGKTVLAGAPGENGYGKALYFIMPPGGWDSLSNENFVTGYLGVGNPAQGDEFGRSVAISKDDSRIVVGAPGRNNNRGGVYVFDKPEGGWINTQTLFPIELPSGLPGDRFGQSVAISSDGKVIAVGASGSDERKGHVYVISNLDTTEGSYDFNALENTPEYENLGISIDISDDGKKVAAAGFGRENSGFIKVYGSDSTEWLESTLIVSIEGRLEDEKERGSMFGFDLDLSDDGDSLLIGAPLFNKGIGATTWFDTVQQ